MANVADHLKNLIARLIDSLNDRTFHLVAAKCMTKNFNGAHLNDYTPCWSSVGRDEVSVDMMEYLRMNPNYHTEILDMSVHIESKGTAKVWLRRVITGLAEGPNRETLGQLTWVLQDGQWLLDSYQGMRGFSIFGGDDTEVGGGL